MKNSITGFFIFLLSRMLILFDYNIYISDVGLYFNQAKQAASGLRFYRDFFYPYPPLSAPFVYLPYWCGGTDFQHYRRFFNLEMFAIELLMVTALVIWLKKKIQFTELQIFSFLSILAMTGLFQGHVLYDRLDMVLSAFSIGLLLLSFSGKKWWWSAILSNLGVLFKFIPIIPATFLFLLDHHKKDNFSIFAKFATFVRLATFIVPALFLIYLIEVFYAPGILKYLGEHGARGIQIESTWASPFLIWKSLMPDSTISIQTIYGAQHLSETSTPVLYQLLSKVSGMLLFFLWAMWILIKKPSATLKLKLLTPLASLLLFLCSQRVLSVQFFIWIAPMVAIIIPFLENRLSWILMTIALYGFTFIAFDLGYWKLVDFNPFFVRAMVARNFVLILITVSVFREWFREARKSDVLTSFNPLYESIDDEQSKG